MRSQLSDMRELCAATRESHSDARPARRLLAELRLSLGAQSSALSGMAEAIEALQQESAEREGLRGLLLDLRGNSGGLLSQATAVVDQFVDVGDLVLVHSADGTEVERATRAMAVAQDLPLVFAGA